MKTPITRAYGLAAIGLWALAAVATAAGQHSPLPDPADDRAPVPSTRYERHLTTAPAAATTPTSSPSDSWKALNREVASFDSMSLTMDTQGPKSAQPEKHEQPIPADSTMPIRAADAKHTAVSPQKPNPHAGHTPPPAAKSDLHDGQASMHGMPGMQAAPHTGHPAVRAKQPDTHEHQNMEHK